MKIILVRHAQSRGNLDPSEYYRTLDCDIELTEKGVDQARQAGDEISRILTNLEFNGGNSPLALISSTYRRAEHTAEIIEKRLIELANNGFHWEPHSYSDPLLVERAWGGLRELIDSRDFKSEIHFNFYYVPPNGGESFFDCYQRVVMFFQELMRKFTGYENVVIVSHGEWIRLALMYLDGSSVQNFTVNRKNPKNCEIIVRNLPINKN